ncbi:MAPK kinase substrate protein, partial [Cucurbita argyrosperma subsp. argyrosperma]
MEGLQRSAVSFRRQGSSGLVWDDRFLSGELKQTAAAAAEKESEENPDAKSTTPAVALEPINTTIERSRSNGGRGYRTGKVSPAIEPPSPKVSACGFCSAFGKPAKKSRRTKTGKRRSR